MVDSEWRVANSFSGGQCYRTAEKISVLNNCIQPCAKIWASQLKRQTSGGDLDALLADDGISRFDGKRR
jgi:hypothetical protein